MGSPGGPSRDGIQGSLNDVLQHVGMSRGVRRRHDPTIDHRRIVLRGPQSRGCFIRDAQQRALGTHRPHGDP
jgi:hypothetical protein